MIKEINQKSKIEGKLTQEDINIRMKKELYNYKEYKKKEYESQNENILEQTTYILEMKKNFGEAFSDILEGYFISTSEILEDEKNPEYTKNYILDLIEFYCVNLKESERQILKKRLIKLFELIEDLSLDTPKIIDVYAYVINIFIDYDTIKLSDLSELKEKEETIEQINNVLKHLSKYYKKRDFKEQLETLPYIKNNRKIFEWVFK